ncbi:MAG: T9SS type A sorting domain-containing protein [Cyclobacteriaceae bacterium]
MLKSYHLTNQKTKLMKSHFTNQKVASSILSFLLLILCSAQIYAQEEIIFVNANLNNVTPREALDSASNVNADNKWNYKVGVTNGTIEGTYFESHRQAGDDAPDITMTISDLDSLTTYNVYAYFISPSTQDWRVMTKLESENEYAIFSRLSVDTANVELINDNDDTPDRLFRALIGEARAVGSEIKVNFSDDMPSEVLRSCIVGVGYQFLSKEDPAEVLSVVDDAMSIMIYPNPTSDFVLLDLGVDNYYSYTVQILDVAGRLMATQRLVGNKNQIVLPEKAGIYMLHLSCPMIGVDKMERIVKN